VSTSKRLVEGLHRSAVEWVYNDHVLVEEVFDTRVLNCCIRADVKRLGEFRKKTVHGLLKIRGWGRKNHLGGAGALWRRWSCLRFGTVAHERSDAPRRAVGHDRVPMRRQGVGHKAGGVRPDHLHHATQLPPGVQGRRRQVLGV